MTLDGALAGKSHRLIAIDLYGAVRVEADWYADGALRALVRRRVEKSLELMNGGYRDIAACRPARRAKKEPPSGRS